MGDCIEVNSLVRTKYDEMDATGHGFSQAVQGFDMRLFSLLAPVGGLTTIAAADPANEALNRFQTLPYDQTRVPVKRAPLTDYINANFITYPRVPDTFILTEGPMENTISRFWAMVWEQETYGIVMLTSLVEGGKTKCAQYWPLRQLSEEQSRGGQPSAGALCDASGAINDPHALVLKDVNLIVRLLCQKRTRGLIYRKFCLIDTLAVVPKMREVEQWQISNWLDHDVPGDSHAFCQIMMLIRQARVDKVGPLVIHCSAGIGRSGAYVLAEIVIRLYEINPSEACCVDPLEVLDSIRAQRPKLIQTGEQLRFALSVIMEGMKRIEASKRGYSLDRFEQEFEDMPIDNGEEDAPAVAGTRGEDRGASAVVANAPTTGFTLKAPPMRKKKRGSGGEGAAGATGGTDMTKPAQPHPPAETLHTPFVLGAVPKRKPKSERTALQPIVNYPHVDELAEAAEAAAAAMATGESPDPKVPSGLRSPHELIYHHRRNESSRCIRVWSKD